MSTKRNRQKINTKDIHKVNTVSDLVAEAAKRLRSDIDGIEFHMINEGNFFEVKVTNNSSI